MNKQLQLGIRLKAIREELGYSQDFVATKLGLTRQAVIGIESGSRKLDSFELFGMADLYGIDSKLLIQSLTGESQEVGLATQPLTRRFAMHLRQHDHLDGEAQSAIREFEQICQDYVFLKGLSHD
ncbi:helix-turn-helix transcriptional regulator [Patescibacteria group bacterium]|nr:helix-turn-helix transcriptional regulator [Patescibacteria group bacterium]